MNISKKIVGTQPCTLDIRGVYDNAIRNTYILMGLLDFAYDETVKLPWKRAGLSVEYGKVLGEKVSKTKEGEVWSWTLEETIQLYYCMDICCRFYVSDVGIKFRKELMITSGNTQADYDKERDFTLGSSENIMREIKAEMKSYPRFKQALAVLNGLKIVPFESKLLDNLIEKRTKGKSLN